nr:hypothetical protein [Tanacetum cinerariifolium]
MRTRSSSNLVGEFSHNTTSSNPKHRNRRCSKQLFILEESPVDTMADQRTMAELLRAPTEGYEEAIVVPPILVEHFELRHSPINMMTSDQFFRLEKDNPHDHIRCFNEITSTIKYKDEDLVSKFINELFPPSRTTNLCNEISNFEQRFDESFHEAWDRYKDLLRACPHHGFTELHQLDTFYNALNSTDQDFLNSAAGGNLLERRTQDVLTIIKNKSKIAKLTHAVNQQTSVVTTAMTVILKQIQATPPPAFVKYVEDICVTCGGAHPYYQCLADDGNTFPKFQDNIQGYVLAATANYNHGNSSYRPPGASINLMPLSVWKTLGLPELISTHITLELANRAICTPAEIARDVFVPVRKFTFLTDFVIVDYESDPRVPFILGRPFLQTACALIDVHGEEMILRDGDERLTLNMSHDTSSYSNQPQKESINMINIFNDSYKDYLKDLFATNHLSDNLTFSSHTDLTSPEVKDDIFDPEGDIVLTEKLLNLDSAKDLPPPHNIDPLSGSTTSSSPNHLLEEFADELALITFPLRNDDLSFDIESDLRELEYLLNHDPTKEMDSILKDLIGESNLANPNNNHFNTIPEMFTDEHALDYSSPPLYDDVDDDLVELESYNDDIYDDSFDSNKDKIKESKLLIDELELPRSSNFLPSLEYDSFLFENFSEVDALPQPIARTKYLIRGYSFIRTFFEVIVRVTPNKNVKKISNAYLILEDFNPPLPLYELPFHKEVLGSETLFSFSSKNKEKVFKPEILTSKGVHTSLLPELSHRGSKSFKVIKIFESPMEIFPCSYGEDILILNVSCLHFYPL